MIRLVKIVVASVSPPRHCWPLGPDNSVVGAALCTVRRLAEFPASIYCSKWKKVKVGQSCLTLCDPMDYIVHVILQARILDWVAFLFSRGSSQPRNWTGVSCIAGKFFTNWAMREAISCIGRWILLPLSHQIQYTQIHMSCDVRNLVPDTMFLRIMEGLFSVYGASLMAQTVKNLLGMQETQVWSLGWEDPLEEGMAL